MDCSSFKPTRFIVAIFFSILFAGVFSQAQLVTEPMKFDKVTPLKIAKTDLAKLKIAELNKKWDECVMFARKSFSKYPDVKPWVLNSWLKCATRFGDDKKGTESLTGALKAFDANRSFLASGPWKSDLEDQMIKARFELIDLLLKNRNKNTEAWLQVESMMMNLDLLDREQKAKLFSFAGELAQAQTQLRAALSFYEKSLDEKENKNARDKYNAVLFALDKTAKPEEVATKTPKPELISESEAKFEERINSALKTNDLVALVDDSISYLGKFPNGKRAKWAQDRILEVYVNVLEKSSDEKMNSLKSKLLSSMEKADALRILDWCRALHRRGDYAGALKLADKALATLGATSQGAVLLYLAGRSAQLTGDYKKATKYFEDYIEFHSGAEDLNEVLFRSGLVYLREQQYSSAIAVFEKLLVLPNIDRYELSARYWLVRSLQATQNQRATQEIENILSAYPFSYYGLKLLAEKNNGLLYWPTDSKQTTTLKSEIYWTTTEKKIWDRMKFLAEQGWAAEALSEYLSLQMPTAPVDKILTAQVLAHETIFPPVVRLVNEAGDLDPSLRSLDIVSLAFPEAFKTEIENEAKKQKLSPVLVRSLIRQESAFGAQAQSASNALGLMQLIPPTAIETSKELGLKNVDVPDDVYIPEINIQMGTFYIAKVIRQFGGNVPLGLAAYNAGPSRVRAFIGARDEVNSQQSKKTFSNLDELWYDELPWFETSFYVKSILRNSMIYKLLSRANAKTLDERRVPWSATNGAAPWADLVLSP